MKSYPASQIRNVAIIGHSGVGKTTIAEACLHVSGVSKRFGRVEEGNTISDYDPEEIKRKNRIPFYPKEWKDSFGLPVEEHRKALEINMLDGYAEFTTGK